jgi:hypothetical protein
MCPDEPEFDLDSTEDSTIRAAITSAITQLAFTAWSVQPSAADAASARDAFDRVYVGHFASIDDYTERLIDDLRLDELLDAAIAAPFREHLDFDVASLSKTLVALGRLYTLPAVPLGVWVFRND